MKRRIVFVLMAAFICLICCSMAFAFDSTSACINPSDTKCLGALSVVSDTTLEITLPSDGVLNYTTITIPATSTVKFKKNSANTPIYMLATSDVQIAGTIDVSGSDGGTLYNGVGGPGGFDGGYGGGTGANVSAGGKGLGPGGGGQGSFITTAPYQGSGGGGGGFGVSGSNGGGSTYAPPGVGGGSYGNAKILPMIGGSGGGGGAGSSYSTYLHTGGFGGGGGGAILIASSTSISITGSIKASAGAGGKSSSTGNYAGCGGGGSGGAIKLMANKISGSGAVSASGGAGGTNYGYGGGAGGAGRVRFETTDLTAWTGTTTPMTVYSSGIPGSVFVTNLPTLTISSVNGVNVSANPSGKFGQVDINLPTGTTNPVSVVVSGTNIPVNTQVTLSSAPEYGSATSSTGSLTGTDASSTTTVSISLSTTYQCILMAQATFAVQTAMYYEDERIDRVRVASTIGGQSQAVYITEKGREIPSEIVLARMME